MKHIIKFGLLFFCANLLFAQTTPRVFERGGNFSYRPPANWTVTEFPGLMYRVVFGPSEGGFTANINFVTETFDGNLNNYVDANLSQLPVFFYQYRLLERGEFITNSGNVGERVVVSNVQNGNALRQIFYFFQLSRNNFIVITCSVLDIASSRLVPIFDESIKTFEIIN